MVASVGRLATQQPPRSRNIFRPTFRDVRYVPWPSTCVPSSSSYYSHILLYHRAGMGMIDTVDSCSGAAFSTLSVFNIGDVNSGSLYQSNFFGLAASALSLATNAVATGLVGYKVWCVTPSNRSLNLRH